MDTSKSSELLRRAREILAKRAAMAEEEGAESGFTLIELMVVLLIMAILLAIAIPTFLGVKGGSQDRAAQSNLTNGLISAKAIYAAQGSYPAAAGLVASMSTQEPDIAFGTAAVTTLSGNPVSVGVSTDGQQLVLVAYSPNNPGGTCWAVSDNEGAATALAGAPTGTQYMSWIASGTNGTACSAATLSAAPSAGHNWATTYPTAAPVKY